MPYTKRLPHHNSAKELILYILDDKNDGEKAEVVSALNCEAETALQQFSDIAKKYNAKGSRVAYHIIQSFCPTDDITPEQAHEIARRMCQELYPDFQCLIGTHTDRGHIHNHICLHSINLNGRKLEDRLANEKEGLYGLSETSDKIAAEYGCFILPKRTFKKCKNKNYYYYQYKEQTNRERIKEDIDKIKIKCSSLEELLDELGILGYEIRRGKYISVKGHGMSKFTRLHSLGEEYYTENLYRYFNEKNIDIDIDLDEIYFKENQFNNNFINKSKESRTAILKSQLAAKGQIYSKYQQTKYREVRRYYQLKKQLEFLDKYNIRSFEDIEQEIRNKRSEIKARNVEIKQNKKEIDEIMEITEKAQTYISLYKTYEYAMYYKDLDKDYILPTEVGIFLNLQNELGIKSVDEAKKLIASSKDQRIEINRMKKEILELQRELNHLDTIKEEELSKSDLFIHNVKFGGNRIDYSKSTDDCWCINLPYVNEILHIEKQQTAFNEKYQFYTLFLVDDKKYEIYNSKGKIIKTITGEELDKYVMDKKKETDQQYSKNSN